MATAKHLANFVNEIVGFVQKILPVLIDGLGHIKGDVYFVFRIHQTLSNQVL